MAYSATLLNTNMLADPISQTAHGFSVGDVVRFDGVDFVLAQADSEANAEIVGIVSNIADADTFWISQIGDVFSLTTGPYVAGTLYYLSPTNAGELTSVKPTTVGQVELPCFIARTTTSGYFFASVGTLIESGSLFAWETITANQTLEVNKGYYINGVGALNDLELPNTASSGDTFILWDIGGNGFTVTQGAGQSIIAGTLTSTIGVGGSIQSTALGNKLIINCFTADTDFICDVSMSAGASIIVT